MRLRKGNRKPSPELAAVRARRREAERKLEKDREEVIFPLHEIRKKNHVYGLLRDIIQQREEKKA